MTPTTAKADNAVKFSKTEGKAGSVSLKEAALVEAVKAFFTLPEASEGEAAYQSVNGAAYPEKQNRDFRCRQCHLRNYEAPRPQKGRITTKVQEFALLHAIGGCCILQCSSPFYY